MSGGRPKGVSLPAEHRANISAALKGKPKSAEHRRRLSEVRGDGRYKGDGNPNWRGGDWALYPREKAQVYNAKTLARRHEVENTLTLPEWLEAIEEYDHRCAYCFGPWDELDHTIPMSKGGANSRENVVPSCMPCNRRRNGANGWLPSVASRFWPRMAEELYA